MSPKSYSGISSATAQGLAGTIVELGLEVRPRRPSHRSIKA
jgi:hypothetical protein